MFRRRRANDDMQHMLKYISHTGFTGNLPTCVKINLIYLKDVFPFFALTHLKECWKWHVLVTPLWCNRSSNTGTQPKPMNLWTIIYTQGSAALSPGSRRWETAACPAEHHWWSGSSSGRAHSHSPAALWPSAWPKGAKRKYQSRSWISVSP